MGTDGAVAESRSEHHKRTVSPVRTLRILWGDAGYGQIRLRTCCFAEIALGISLPRNRAWVREPWGANLPPSPAWIFSRQDRNAWWSAELRSRNRFTMLRMWIGQTRSTIAEPAGVILMTSARRSLGSASRAIKSAFSSRSNRPVMVARVTPTCSAKSEGRIPASPAFINRTRIGSRAGLTP
jgi:hypothetical protein